MSPKINQAAWRQGISFALCLVLILVLAGAPISVAIKAVAVIATQIISGAYIYSRIPRSRSTTIPEYLGMGFAIGSALSMLCDIFLKSTGIGSVAWLLPTFVIVFATVAQNLKKERVAVTRIQETRFESTYLLAILVISFLYLAHDFDWYISLFVSGLCILVIVNLRDRYKTRGFYLRSVIALTALATTSLLVGIQFRSPSWWINSDDYQLFESLQISLGRYGPKDQLGAAGISITKTHFFAYAWTGLIDRVSDAPTWIILNRITPVIVSIIMSALIWSFLSREGSQRPNLRFLLACLYPILFIFSFGSPSSAIGYIFLLAAAFYWTDRESKINYWYRIPLGVLFTISVIGTKTSNTPAIIAGLGALALIGVATNQSWKWISLADLLIVLVTGTFYYFLLIRDSSTASALWVEPFGFAKQIFSDLNQIDGPWLIIIGGITSSAYVIIPLLGVIISKFSTQSRSSMWECFTLPMFPLLILYILFVGGWIGTSTYFVNSVLSIMLLTALLAVSKSLPTNRLNKQDIFQLAIFVTTGITLGITSKFLLHRLKSDGMTEMFGRAIAVAHWIPLVVVGGIWYFYRIRKFGTPRRGLALLSLILVGEIFASTTVFALDLYQIARQPPLPASTTERVIGTPDEIAVGKEIRSWAPIDSIIASNHFCGRENCFGANWFNEQVNNFQINANTAKKRHENNYDGTLFGGANFVLSAYSERRFLIQGPRFLWGLNDPPLWAIDRMNATLGFANGPSEQTLKALRKFDVEYFVVDLESTTQRTWLPFGKLLYQNHSFAFLQLRHD